MHTQTQVTKQQKTVQCTLVRCYMKNRIGRWFIRLSYNNVLHFGSVQCTMHNARILVSFATVMIMN